MWPRRTLGEHFCHYPSPDGAAPHARGTLRSRSVAQRGRAARPGNTSAPFRRPTGHLSTLGRHFSPIPSPNGASQHARATLQPRSVAQCGRVARPGNTSIPFPSPGRAGQGKRTGGGAGPESGAGLVSGAGGRKRQRHRHGHRDGNGNKSSRR